MFSDLLVLRDLPMSREIAQRSSRAIRARQSHPGGSPAEQATPGAMSQDLWDQQWSGSQCIPDNYRIATFDAERRAADAVYIADAALDVTAAATVDVDRCAAEAERRCDCHALELDVALAPNVDAEPRAADAERVEPSHADGGRCQLNQDVLGHQAHKTRTTPKQSSCYLHHLHVDTKCGCPLGSKDETPQRKCRTAANTDEQRRAAPAEQRAADAQQMENEH